MKYVSIFLLVLATLGLVGLARITLRHMDRTPTQRLDDARRVLDNPVPDLQRALTELEQALMGARTAEDTRLEAEILTTRGDVYQRMLATTKARDDFARVQDLDPEAQGIASKLLLLDYHNREYEQGLAYSDELLAADPENVFAQTYRGRFLVRIADLRMDAARTLVHDTLPDEPSVRAIAIVELLTGIDPDDPGRLALVHELRGLFPEHEEPRVRQLLRIIEDATVLVADARGTLAASFGNVLQQDAVAQYVEILDRAGYVHEAVDFGLAASQVEFVGNDPPTLRLIVDALVSIGRADAACDLIEERMSKRVLPNTLFLRSWCEALREAGRWTRLVSVAGQLRQQGDVLDKALASFYTGYAFAERNNYRQAGPPFQDYVGALTEGVPRPIPDVRAYIERVLGKRALESGQTNAGLGHLKQAVKLSPEADGEAWIEIADAQAKVDPGDLLSVEVALTHAIRVLPERISELETRWRTIGEANLGPDAGTLQQQIDALQRRGLCTPPVSVGPYELFRLAEFYAQRGSPPCVIAATQRLLADYPGFLPALDLLIAAALETQNWSLAGTHLLERLRRGGPHAPTQVAIAALPPGALTRAQQFELMQLDPSRMGRLTVVRHLRAAGEQERALGGLLSMSRSDLRDDGRILAGDLLLDVGRYTDALRTLALIEDTSPYYDQALQRRIRAAALAGSGEQVDELLTTMSDTPLDRKALLEAVDDLWRNRLFEQAQRLLDVLDSDPETRGTDVLLRIGMNALLAGDRRAALEAFDRAEAFDRSGQAALGRLIVAVESRQWDVLPVYVRELLATQFQADELGSVVLAALDERLDEAWQQCSQLVAAHPNDPLCYVLKAAIQTIRVEPVERAPAIGETGFQALAGLLFGEPTYSTDPRQTLVQLLASRQPDWRGWSAASWQERGSGPEGSVWANYLAALTLTSDGRLADAARLANSTVKRWSDFRPIWSLLEDITAKQLGRLDHPQLVALRQERRQAIGDEPGEEAEEALARAYVLQRNGQVDRALSEARKAVELDGTHLSALRLLAELHEQNERWRDAMELYRKTALTAPRAVAHEFVADYIEFLERAHAKAPTHVPRASVAAELEILGHRIPDDPLIALARAREELVAAGSYSYVRVKRAYESLDLFRKENAGRPLDELRQGASRAWMQFYAALDPRRAETFIRDELVLQPGSLDLWILHGETLVAQDRWDAAIEHFETVLTMMPDSSTRRHLVRLLADYGSDLERLEEQAAAILGIDGDPTDVEVHFHMGRGLARAGGEKLDRGIELLAKLWLQDARTAEIPRADIGRAYGTALLFRGTGRDRRVAHDVLLEVAPAISDPIQRNLAVALGNLAGSSLR